MEPEIDIWSLKTFVTFSLGLAGFLLVLVCCLCRMRRCKTEFDERMKEKKLRRIENQAGPAAIFTLDEELYVQMSVDLMKKDDLIGTLKDESVVPENQIVSPKKTLVQAKDEQ